jgi:predicted nucleotide-binding protein
LLRALEITRDAIDNDVYGELQGPSTKSKSPAISNRVFIVHGHDAGLKTDLERFLRELGLEPVVLHREVDAGATVIEKFEKHADLGFAFVLLTPDEVAYTVDQIEVPEPHRKTERRARPNVIFEFGYFVGKLGRSRVCCLYKAGVAMPSDLNGLIYKEVGASLEPQAYSIIKELKAAGYSLKF